MKILNKRSLVVVTGLTLATAFTSCSSKPAKQADRISNPEGVSPSVDEVALSADEAVERQWKDLESRMVGDLQNVYTGQGTFANPNEEDQKFIKDSSERIARDFIETARGLGVESATSHYESLKQKIDSNLDEDLKAHLILPETEILTAFGIIYHHFSQAQVEIQREKNGFLKNLYDDVNAITAVGETYDHIAKNGLSAIKPSLRPIDANRKDDIVAEHSIRGGVSALGAAISLGLARRAGTVGYRQIVTSHEPVSVIDKLVATDPKLVKIRNQVLEVYVKREALFAEIEKLKADLRAVETTAYRLEAEMGQFGRDTAEYQSRFREWAKQGNPINNLQAKINKLEPKLGDLNVAFRLRQTTLETAIAKTRAKFQYELKEGKFSSLEGGFKSQKELVKALRRANYGEFSVVRMGSRLVLKVAGVAMAGFALAELVPMTMGEEIVWVPGDVASALSGTQSSNE